jgi:deoxyribonuclease-4
MARVYLGPGGIPIGLRDVRKNPSTVDGVRYVRSIGLNAMEVEFVQGVRMSRESAEELGNVARELGVRLSVHAPYFINLCSEELSKVEASMQRLWESLDRGYAMGATVVVFHPAYYRKRGRGGCYSMVKDAVVKLLDWMSREGVSTKLGLEVAGRKSQFGDLEETFNLVKEVGDPRVVAVVDWGHVYARYGGRIDYAAILRSWRDYFGNEPMHTHFTGVKYRGGEWKDEHEPIENDSPPFEPLAKVLGEEDMEITLISESPLLELDALKMKDALIRYGNTLVFNE